MSSSRSRSSTEDPSIESTHRESESEQANELLETEKFKIGEAREENKNLKRKLAQMEKNYRSMQVRFFDILRQEASCRKPTDDSCSLEDTKESGLVSLCLGMNPMIVSERDKEKETKEHSPKVVVDEEDEGLDTKLQLFAEVRTSSTSPRLQEHKEEEETWPPNKIQKTSTGEDDDALPQTQAKRTRVSVRARCDSPTMNDGCQWRKYGQKIAKGNPCPRAYYRCTVAPGCPVRKQVQRCVDDMSILTTTYEGTHNHPLPVSATAMASTTSAAASMLLSGSSTSSQTPPTTISGFNGLNFSIYDNSRNRFYMPNTPSLLHPTITLDLTTPSMQPNQFSMARPGFPQLNSLNFSTSGQGVLPLPWSSYGPRQNPNHPSYVAGNTSSSHQSFTETLTKALTTDPSFQSVIAAALSSMVAPNINGSGL